MDNKLALREDMLVDISALDFMLTDLNLYLDTHPDDINALMLFNNIKNQSDMCRKQFAETFGPLRKGSTSNTEWNWIKNPWPWDKGGMC